MRNRCRILLPISYGSVLNQRTTLQKTTITHHRRRSLSHLTSRESSRKPLLPLYSFHSANWGRHASSQRVPKRPRSLAPRKTHAFCGAVAALRLSRLSHGPTDCRAPSRKSAALARDYRDLAISPRSKFIRRLLRLLRPGRRKLSF